MILQDGGSTQFDSERDKGHSKLLCEHIQRNVYKYDPEPSDPLYHHMMDDMMATSIIETVTSLQGQCATQIQRDIIHQKLNDYNMYRSNQHLNLISGIIVYNNPYAQTYISMEQLHGMPAEYLLDLERNGQIIPSEHCVFDKYDSVTISDANYHVDLIERVRLAYMSIYNGVIPSDYYAGEAIKNCIMEQFKEKAVMLPSEPVNSNSLFRCMTLDAIVNAVCSLNGSYTLSCEDVKYIKDSFVNSNINIDKLYSAVVDYNNGIPIDYSMIYDNLIPVEVPYSYSPNGITMDDIDTILHELGMDVDNAESYRSGL